VRCPASHGHRDRGLPPGARAGAGGRVDVPLQPLYRAVQRLARAHHIVDIHEMEPRIFALALEYTCDCTCIVHDVTLLRKVLSAVAVLQIDSLFAVVAAALEKSLTADKCASMLACADRHHVPQLAMEEEEIQRNAFVDVAPFRPPTIPMPSMVALLQSCHLDVISTEQMFETLSRWLKGQAEHLGEEEHLTMFGLVRFTLHSQYFLSCTGHVRARVLDAAHSKARVRPIPAGFSRQRQAYTAWKALLGNSKAHWQILSRLDTAATTQLELLYCTSSDG